MNNFFDLKCFLLDPERQLPKEASKDNVRTWLEYKKGGGVEDPDSSDDAREFYEKIWKGLLEKSGLSLRPDASGFSKKPDQYVQGDWMCSVATTFRNGLILFVEDNDEWESELNTFREKYHLERRPNDGVGGPNTYGEILLDDMNSDEQKFRKFWEDEALKKFIRSAYTPANLIIVPDGFNSARYTRGESGTEDYWDLTLKKFYHDKDPLDYTDRNDGKKYDVATPFRELLKKNQEQGDPLCLSEWLDQENKPKMLPNKNPTSMEEWRELMLEMTRRIDHRRNQMAQCMKRRAAKNR